MTVYTKRPPRLDAREILDRVDWAAFWRDELPEAHFKQDHGWQCGGCNPLRGDAHAGSFRVNLDTGAWTDFADSKGDGPGWLIRRYGLTFAEALEVLRRYSR